MEEQQQLPDRETEIAAAFEELNSEQPAVDPEQQLDGPPADPDEPPEDELPDDDEDVEEPESPPEDTDEDASEQATQETKGTSRWQRAKRSYERKLAASDERYQKAEQNFQQEAVRAAAVKQHAAELKDEANYWRTKAQEFQEMLSEYNEGPSPAELELEHRDRAEERVRARKDPSEQVKARLTQEQMATDFVHEAKRAEATYGGHAAKIFKRWVIEHEMTPADQDKPSISDIAKAMKAERVQKKRTADPNRANLEANRNAVSTMKGGPGQGAPSFPATPEGMLAFLEATDGD